MTPQFLDEWAAPAPGPIFLDGSLCCISDNFFLEKVDDDDDDGDNGDDHNDNYDDHDNDNFSDNDKHNDDECISRVRRLMTISRVRQ